MWNCAARRGGRALLCTSLGPSSSLASCRRSLAASAAASPPGEGRLEFQTRRYPSFWDRLKQQKQGLGNIALAASVGFLAVSIIKQEKELARATESADRLRQENEVLIQKLEDCESVLAKSEEGKKTERDVVALLREALKGNGGRFALKVSLDSPDETDDAIQSSPRSKFMV